MTKDEALKLALEALTPFSTPNWAWTGVDKANEAITAIKQARSAFVQEPSGFFRHEDVCGDEVGPPTPYYLTPPAAQRQWVGLTDEDLANCSGHEVRWALYWEKLLKGKNT
jgi:hypothetical protein